MALKPCRECGKQVSDHAKTCPNCGYKNRSGNGGRLIAIIITVCIGVIVMISNSSNSGSGQTPVPQSSPAIQSSENPTSPSVTVDPKISDFQKKLKNYLIGMDVPIGARGQIDPARGNSNWPINWAMACPDEADLINFMRNGDAATKMDVGGQMSAAEGGNINDATQEELQGQQAEQNVLQLAFNAGCQKFQSYTTGVVIAKDGVDPTKNRGLDGYVEVQMDNGSGNFWMLNYAFVPLHELQFPL